MNTDKTKEEFMLAEYRIWLKAPLSLSDARATIMIQDLRELNIPEKIDDYLRGLKLPLGISTIKVFKQ